MLQTSYLSERILPDGISTVPGGYIRRIHFISQRYYGRLLGVIGPLSLSLLLIREDLLFNLLAY